MMCGRSPGRRALPILALSALLGCELIVKFEPVEEHGAQCSDGIDNDGDHLVDCMDPGCFADPACMTGAADGPAGSADAPQDLPDAPPPDGPPDAPPPDALQPADGPLLLDSVIAPPLAPTE